MRKHVAYLASDDMRGRATGSPEYERASRYVEELLREYRLQPLFGDSFRQTMRLLQLSFAKDGWVQIDGPAGRQRLQVLEDAVFMNTDHAAGWEGPFEMVYVGLGIREPDAGWNDYAGLDLQGKCAVLVVDSPEQMTEGLPRDLLLRYRDPSHGTNQKAAAAVDEGARCLLGVLSPWAPKDLRSLVQQPATLRQLQTVAATPASRSQLPVAAVLSARGAEVLFAGQKQSAFAAGRNRGFALEGEVRFHTEVDTVEKWTASNIGALLPGSDPQLANEVLVLSAHLDGQGMRGRTVLNSANDNASSVAALLEAARLLSQGKVQRSVAFLFTAAEEEGLLGARFFLDHPPFPLESILLNINMEMIGKPASSRSRHRFRVKGRVARNVKELAHKVDRQLADARFDYTFRSDDDGQRLFRFADHAAFFLRGIPALYFYGGSADYHQPTDDPEGLNYPKVAVMSEVLVALVQQSDRGWAPSPPVGR